MELMRRWHDTRRIFSHLLPPFTRIDLRRNVIIHALILLCWLVSPFFCCSSDDNVLNGKVPSSLISIHGRERSVRKGAEDFS